MKPSIRTVGCRWRQATLALGMAGILFAGAAHAAICSGALCLKPGAQSTTFGTVTRSGAGTFQPVSIWNMGGGNFDVAFTLPILPVPVTYADAKGAPINFQDKAEAAAGAYVGKAGGWSFAVDPTPLPDGTFTVTSYAVSAGPGSVGILTKGTTRGFAVSVDAASAPAGNLHWVQVLADNFNITNKPGWGNAENVLDNAAIENKKSSGLKTPYYDAAGPANGSAFYDNPSRNNPQNLAQNDWWLADLFLATGPGATRTNTGAPGAVTLYDTGIQYGWANIHISLPAAAKLSALDQIFGSFTSSSKNLENILDCDPADCPLDADLTPDYLQQLDTDFDAAVLAIPEPSSWALLVLGVFGVGAMLRRARRKTWSGGLELRKSRRRDRGVGVGRRPAGR